MGFTGHRWIPLTKTSDAELWFFLWSMPQHRLSKQSRRRWFQTPSRSLWRHCNGYPTCTPDAPVCHYVIMSHHPVALRPGYIAMVVTDALAPNWHQATRNHPADSTVTTVEWQRRWTIPEDVHIALITLFLRQIDVVTSFWRNNDVIVTSCVR